MANFFCEMLLRLYSRGLCGIDRFHLPITQTDLAECCGMTPVHTNRMLAELRDQGVCTFSQGMAELDRELRARLSRPRGLPLASGPGSAHRNAVLTASKGIGGAVARDGLTTAMVTEMQTSFST